MSKLPINISIVIPTWNRPTSVRRLVDQVTRDEDSGDIEVVIVDDCSDENNWELLSDLKNSNENVRLYRNSQNIGMTRNWNRAVELAKGQWIGFMCDDDIYKADSIGRIRAYISSVSEPCLILQNASISEEIEWIEPGSVAANQVALPPASGQFWHRQLTDKLGGFDERIKYCPDAEFWPRMAYHYPVLLVRDYIVVPNQHSTNYMWEIFRKPDFLEQVTLSIRLGSRWTLGAKSSDETLVQCQINEGIWETLRTVLNNTFLKPTKMKNFPKYLCKFIHYSFLLDRKILMLKTIVNLPVLRIKEYLRPLALALRLLKND